MPTGNPLEQLRRRMQSHATPTAFAALAEEHRRAGRFAEAVAVCREGLERYPAYVSARVTLGRALLDSGDTPGAVTELELAVAQSPDNLAAARALETARAALGDTPWPPAATADVSTDLPLQAPAEDTPIASSVIATALGTGPDGPQEFGLAPDWSLPDAPPPLPVVVPPPLRIDDEQLPSLYPHVESAAIEFAPEAAQGEEPAGIWPAQPVVDDDQTFAWPVESAAPESPDVWVAEEQPAPEAQESSSVWGDLTIEVAPDDRDATADLAAQQEPAPTVAATAPEVALDDDSSSFWTGVFGGEAAVEEAAPFAGWGEDVPPVSAEADQSPWAGEDAVESQAWNTPDGPSATWALGDLHEAEAADATPFQGALEDEQPRPDPFANFAGPAASAGLDTPATFSMLAVPEIPLEAAPPALLSAPDDAPDALWTESSADVPEFDLSAVPEELPELPPIPGAANEPEASASADVDLEASEVSELSVEPAHAGEAWSGSLKSALGEVFALAGHADSLEPPGHPSPVVREAMADAAVDAAREDAALREDGPPVLASLEQLLAAVRARRAALAGSLDS